MVIIFAVRCHVKKQTARVGADGMGAFFVSSYHRTMVAISLTTYFATFHSSCTV